MIEWGSAQEVNVGEGGRLVRGQGDHGGDEASHHLQVPAAVRLWTGNLRLHSSMLPHNSAVMAKLLLSVRRTTELPHIDRAAHCHVIGAACL